MTPTLHLDRELFEELLQNASERLNIPIYFIEKDYYISLILRHLSLSEYQEQIVFKGGTSLSKAYDLINRFSEDVDFAVVSQGMSGNQIKTLLSKLMKAITRDLTEDNNYSDPSKGSRYRKQAFLYPSQVRLSNPQNPIPTRVIVEISAFANPFPYDKRSIEPLVTTFLKGIGMYDFIETHNLHPFELNVLSLRQTLCEKVVSLIRASTDEDPKSSLASKIRHFYDLNALLSTEDLQHYIQQNDFKEQIKQLILHDQEIFTEPSGWQSLQDLQQSPLLQDFPTLWKDLTPSYKANLSAIAYQTIPSTDMIQTSFELILNALENIRLKEREWTAQ